MPFQIVDHLEYAPGCCKGCGLTRPGRYVDTLEFDEANARIYYCEHCVKDWALHLGILTGEVKIVERVREPNAEEVGRFVLACFQLSAASNPLMPNAAQAASQAEHIAANLAFRERNGIEPTPFERTVAAEATAHAALLQQPVQPQPPSKPRAPRRSGGRRKKAGP